MTARMMSTQQLNRRHEDKLHALEEQLSLERVRFQNKLREDSLRLHQDLIRLRIRTPNTAHDYDRKTEKAAVASGPRRSDPRHHAAQSDRKQMINLLSAYHGSDTQCHDPSVFYGEKSDASQTFRPQVQTGYLLIPQQNLHADAGRFFKPASGFKLEETGFTALLPIPPTTSTVCSAPNTDLKSSKRDADLPLSQEPNSQEPNPSEVLSRNQTNGMTSQLPRNFHIRPSTHKALHPSGGVSEKQVQPPQPVNVLEPREVNENMTTKFQASTNKELLKSASELPSIGHLLQNAQASSGKQIQERATRDRQGAFRRMRHHTVLPTVEVLGSNVKYYYQGEGGRPKPFKPDIKMQALLERTNLIGNTLTRLHDRQHSRHFRQLPQEKPKENVHNNDSKEDDDDLADRTKEQFENLMKGWSQVADDRQKKEKTTRRKAKMRSMLTMKGALADAGGGRLRAGASQNAEDSSLSGWRLLRLFRIWSSVRTLPVWATSSYQRRKNQEAESYYNKCREGLTGSSSKQTDLSTTVLQAMSAGTSRKRTMKAAKSRNGDDNGHIAVAAIKKLQKTSPYKLTAKAELRSSKRTPPIDLSATSARNFIKSTPLQRHSPSSFQKPNNTADLPGSQPFSKNDTSTKEKRTSFTPSFKVDSGDSFETTVPAPPRRSFKESSTDRVLCKAEVAVTLAGRRAQPVVTGKKVVLTKDLKMSVGNMVLYTGSTRTVAPGSVRRPADVFLKTTDA